MWDSGIRPTPDLILESVRAAVAAAVRDQQRRSLPDLAADLRVHVRTLQAAARTGRLEVHYVTRSVFGRPLRLSTLAAGKVFLRTTTKSTADRRPVPSKCLNQSRQTTSACCVSYGVVSIFRRATSLNCLARRIALWCINGNPGNACPRQFSGIASRVFSAGALTAGRRHQEVKRPWVRRRAGFR